MLTATYSLVALSTEQHSARCLLWRTRQLLQHDRPSRGGLDLAGAAAAFDILCAFENACHARKLEADLIPMLRGASAESDSLLDELDCFSIRGASLLRSVQQQLAQALDKGLVQLHALRDAMELYCDNLLRRLAREEDELLPMAARILSAETWFDLGARFLAADAKRYPHLCGAA